MKTPLIPSSFNVISRLHELDPALTSFSFSNKHQIFLNSNTHLCNSSSNNYSDYMFKHSPSL